MAATNGGGLATPPTTPPALTKAQVLNNVLSLATQFSTCVEAFNLIHPSRETDREQRIALAKLGIQQGRLLIFGDAVGISSPPATIAKHMIPSHPGATNPDPHLPVNFGVRDPRLDDAGTNEKVRAALNEIAGRPAYLSREELMEKYGLKSPKRFSSLGYPALDTNRLEAFREKYALLQDLVRQSGAKANTRRAMSMTMNTWTVRDVAKFDEFVKTVRTEVDGLIDFMGVKEQVDRGMRSDIRAMGWHPDLNGSVVRQDWEKLKLIRQACEDDYPEYVDVTDTALKYINDELKGTHLDNLRAAYQPAARRKSEEDASEKPKPKVTESAKPPEKEKRPGWLSHFKFKSWSKSHKSRSKSIASPASDDQDPQRSLSESMHKNRDSNEMNGLEPVRSKSLSAIPDEPAPLNLDTRLQETQIDDDKNDASVAVDPLDKNPLVHTETAKSMDDPNPLAQATTVQSLIDRHDMYKGVGRTETKDIRNQAHGWVGS